MFLFNGCLDDKKRTWFTKIKGS